MTNAHEAKKLNRPKQLETHPASPESDFEMPQSPETRSDLDNQVLNERRKKQVNEDHTKIAQLQEEIADEDEPMADEDSSIQNRAENIRSTLGYKTEIVRDHGREIIRCEVPKDELAGGFGVALWREGVVIIAADLPKPVKRFTERHEMNHVLDADFFTRHPRRNIFWHVIADLRANRHALTDPIGAIALALYTFSDIKSVSDLINLLSGKTDRETSRKEDAPRRIWNLLNKS